MPPQISVSKIAQYLKGKTSRKLLEENALLKKKFWELIFGERIFAVSSGSITDEMIMEYIENQDEEADKRGDDFTVIEA